MVKSLLNFLTLLEEINYLSIVKKKFKVFSDFCRTNSILRYLELVLLNVKSLKYPKFDKKVSIKMQLFNKY